MPLDECVCVYSVEIINTFPAWAKILFSRALVKTLSFFFRQCNSMCFQFYFIMLTFIELPEFMLVSVALMLFQSSNVI